MAFSMKTSFTVILACSIFLLATLASISSATTSATGGNGTMVDPTFISIDAGAVCLTGQPASYYLLKGFGNGTRNWLVYLSGGGWCQNISDCQIYKLARATDVPIPLSTFGVLFMNTSSDRNPEFFNWNKVWVRYCDGSSFTGNSHITAEDGTILYFRGARIFNALIHELLAKGMGKAENALLVGSSAGGLATTIHCDTYRGFFPSTSRVKCLSDSGYFFLSKHHSRRNKFVSIFQGLIKMHGSTPALPKSCTSRLPAAMCLFPENLQADIRTPIFFLMSSFDTVQINYTLSNEDALCSKSNNCTSSQLKALQELRSEFLDVLPKEENSPIKGVLIYSEGSHTLLYSGVGWNATAPMGSKQTRGELFRDWYFDRKTVVDIVDNYPCPYNCT